MIKKHNKLKCNKEVNAKTSTRSNDELELSLEVEIDDEVKEIIKSPKKCASTLLDVTIIRPEDVDKFYTIHKKTLKGNEVKKFIKAMNLNKNDVKKVIDNMLEASKGKSAGDYDRNSHHPGNMRNTNELNGNIKKLLLEDDMISDEFSVEKVVEKVNQIYTTPKTFQELNSIFQCKNRYRKDDNGKPNMPCVCENCAIVGVVTDSQKKTFGTEKTYDPLEQKYKRDFIKKRKVSYCAEDHNECQYYFKYLSAKIKSLEARLSAQEDKTVPKDYFRKIITKLVANISKLSSPSQTHLPSSSRRSRAYSTDDHSYENFRQKHTKTYNVSSNDTKTFTRPSSKKTSSSVNDTPFWKWGEEVLRPGIDIKNKIGQLLEETIKNLKGSKPSSGKSDMKQIANQMPNNIYKTVHDIPEKEEAAHKRKEKEFLRKRSIKGVSSVNVSYINPTQWDESQMSLIMESEDENRDKSSQIKPVEYCKKTILI